MDKLYLIIVVQISIRNQKKEKIIFKKTIYKSGEKLTEIIMFADKHSNIYQR